MSLKDEESSSWLEIVEVAPGQIELRREMGEERTAVEEPLLRLQFSADAQLMLGEHLVAVTQAMIAAGLQTAGELQRRMLNGEGGEARLLH